MNSRAKATFVGFGFGPIQAGLFLTEACRSGHFERLVVAYRRPEVIAAVRRAGGMVAVNVAHTEGIDRLAIGPLEMFDVGVELDRDEIVRAVAEAGEIATALSSIRDYVSPAAGSVHHLLARGLLEKLKVGGPRVLIYSAENHPHAAEVLAAAVAEEIPTARREAAMARASFLNTVIAKMSGTVHDPGQIAEQGLAIIAVGVERAFLVEAFDDILVSRIGEEFSFRRGLSSFREQEDLKPFEEAKLYGHNAVHALLAYLGMVLGVTAIAELQEIPGILDFARSAYLQEAGAALIRRYSGIDPLFTEEGFRAYGDDLLARMMNPHLRDTVARVGRDIPRKLAWSDRLVGTMRLVLSEGLIPLHFALGTAAALAALQREDDAETFLTGLWSEEPRDPQEEGRVLELIRAGIEDLKAWRESGFAPLESWFAAKHSNGTP